MGNVPEAGSVSPRGHHRRTAQPETKAKQSRTVF